MKRLAFMLVLGSISGVALSLLSCAPITSSTSLREPTHLTSFIRGYTFYSANSKTTLEVGANVWLFDRVDGKEVAMVSEVLSKEKDHVYTIRLRIGPYSISPQPNEKEESEVTVRVFVDGNVTSDFTQKKFFDLLFSPETRLNLSLDNTTTQRISAWVRRYGNALVIDGRRYERRRL